MKVALESSVPVSNLITEPTTSGDAVRSRAKLTDAAQQFEAMMWQELLKPMRTGQDSWGGEEKNVDGGEDTISSFGTEAVAKAISKGGGFGIARQIIRQVSTEQEKQPQK
jgi:peptidoglycan hydrolase FlgJ